MGVLQVFKSQHLGAGCAAGPWQKALVGFDSVPPCRGAVCSAGQCMEGGHIEKASVNRGLEITTPVLSHVQLCNHLKINQDVRKRKWSSALSCSIA